MLIIFFLIIILYVLLRPTSKFATLKLSRSDCYRDRSNPYLKIVLLNRLKIKIYQNKFCNIRFTSTEYLNAIGLARIAKFKARELAVAQS